MSLSTASHAYQFYILAAKLYVIFSHLVSPTGCQGVRARPSEVTGGPSVATDQRQGCTLLCVRRCILHGRSGELFGQMWVWVGVNMHVGVSRSGCGWGAHFYVCRDASSMVVSLSAGVSVGVDMGEHQ